MQRSMEQDTWTRERRHKSLKGKSHWMQLQGSKTGTRIRQWSEQSCRTSIERKWIYKQFKKQGMASVQETTVNRNGCTCSELQEILRVIKRWSFYTSKHFKQIILSKMFSSLVFLTLNISISFYSYPLLILPFRLNTCIYFPHTY